MCEAIEQRPQKLHTKGNGKNRRTANLLFARRKFLLLENSKLREPENHGEQVKKLEIRKHNKKSAIHCKYGRNVVIYLIVPVGSVF